MKTRLSGVFIFVAGLDVFPSCDLVGIPVMHFRHFWGGPRIERAIGSVQLSSLHGAQLMEPLECLALL